MERRANEDEAAVQPAETTARRAEREADDWWSLWRRRPELLLVIAGCSIAALGGWLLWWQATNEVKELSVKFVEAEDNRRHAEAQLAPFLASANRHFTNVPSDERLGLLLSAVTNLSLQMDSIAEGLPKPVGIRREMVPKLVNDLNHLPRTRLALDMLDGYDPAFELRELLLILLRQSQHRPHQLGATSIMGLRGSRSIVVMHIPGADRRWLAWFDDFARSADWKLQVKQASDLDEGAELYVRFGF